ncbi:MAG: hypothetical protein PHI84_22145 [Kiritimatiellae bacterium]|nr:hypothetical protein [Kiritimatiellia bacterium]
MIDNGVIVPVHVDARINAEIVRRGLMAAQAVNVSSIWNVEHWRMGTLLGITQDHNLVTNEGKNSLLNIMFHAATQIATWYFVLFEDDYTPLATNTYAVPGFTETEAYDELTRPEFVEIESTAQTTNNSVSKATFTFNATKTIYGGGLVGGGTDPAVKADAAGGGVLYCSAKFAETKPVASTDVLKVWITLTAS